MSDVSTEAPPHYDVTICGGGLAGLTLARQLNLRMPELSVLVIDKMARPLPAACHKVGESTIEAGATYFSRVCKLKDYLKQHQLPKLGLRFFWGDSKLPLEERYEYGLSKFADHASVQLDRGTFESDLRAFAVETGSTLWEGVAVEDIVISETDEPHRVICRDVASKEERVVSTRWLIDASGRRALIKRKLGLAMEFGRKHSSSWWRLEGRVDIDDVVAADTDAQRAWHDRVPDKNRFYSTNHLLGNHYWLWLIPLASGYTSIGIVADEDHHPFDTFNTYERSVQWMHDNEPVLAKFLEKHEPKDFLVMRRYTYSAKQVFSPHRWACVGEAGVFSDPYFSTGSDLIGAANCMVSEMIRLDMREHNLPPSVVATSNQIFLMGSRAITENIQRLYDFSTNAVVGGTRYLWGNIVGPPLSLPVIFGFLHHEGCYSDQEKIAALIKIQGIVTGPAFTELGKAMVKLFEDWLAMSPNTARFEFIDYLSIPAIAQIFERAFDTTRSAAELVEGTQAMADLAERVAHAVFLIALEDVMPEQLARFPQPLWLNVRALSLHPERWEADGLFQPTTPPGDVLEFYQAMRRLFTFAPRGPSARATELVDAVRQAG